MQFSPMSGERNRDNRLVETLVRSALVGQGFGVNDVGRQESCPGRLDGSTEHRGSGVVFSARDLQRGEKRGKATCVNRTGAFSLLPNETKPGILYLAAK